MQKTKNFYFLIALVLFFFLATLSNSNNNNSDYPSISFSVPATIKNTPILLGFALTEGERVRGLSGQQNLAENQGLLFVFDQESIWGIWMKDMKFAIDVIWLDNSFKIVDLRSDFRPDSFPETAVPKLPAKYVLEIRANFAQKHEINIGDILKISSQTQ